MRSSKGIRSPEGMRSSGGCDRLGGCDRSRRTRLSGGMRSLRIGWKDRLPSTIAWEVRLLLGKVHLVDAIAWTNAVARGLWLPGDAIALGMRSLPRMRPFLRYDRSRDAVALRYGHLGDTIAWGMWSFGGCDHLENTVVLGIYTVALGTRLSREPIALGMRLSGDATVLKCDRPRDTIT